MAFLELILSYIITLIAGTVCGIAFSKFLFLIFVNMIGGNYFNLVISPTAIILLAFLFLIFFLVLMMIGVWIIWRSSSLDLLREESKGEKEPKSNLFFAIAAVILLAAGYYIALTVDNPISALMKFFIAVLLVIFGTYLFYISFTVWYLKLKKKRASYYKPNNFITTSSMLYRMKANAVGLGNITILLSMTIVTVVISLGVFLGTENVVKTFYTREAQVFTVASNENRQEDIERIKSAADSKKIDIKNISDLYFVQDHHREERAVHLHGQNTGIHRLGDQPSVHTVHHGGLSGVLRGDDPGRHGADPVSDESDDPPGDDGMDRAVRWQEGVRGNGGPGNPGIRGDRGVRIQKDRESANGRSAQERGVTGARSAHGILRRRLRRNDPGGRR